MDVQVGFGRLDTSLEALVPCRDQVVRIDGTNEVGCLADPGRENLEVLLTRLTLTNPPLSLLHTH